jgi:hypothetical protein
MSGYLSNAKRVVAAMALASFALVGISSVASAGSLHPSSWHRTDTPSSFSVAEVLAGSSLTHTFTASASSASVSAPLSNIDDLTQLGNELFVAFQNGVGPNGEASAAGNLDSTVVEFTPSGRVLGQWDVAGRIDGVVADPILHGVILTVNEDGNSSLYVIDTSAPSAQQVTHFSYDSGLTHGGGTDSLTMLHGQILISASNPGTSLISPPNATFPAVYTALLDFTTKVAKLTPLFFDEDAAKVANVGSTNGTITHLALTDPDSSAVVPDSATRFAGAFELTSQGDQQQIFVRHAGTSRQTLSVLSLSQSVDDTAWALSRLGRLYSTDSATDSVDVVSGRFSTTQPYVVATPCNANSAPSVCLAPNYLATVNPWSGVVSPVTVTGVAYSPKGGLIFVAGSECGDGRHNHYGEHHRR